MNQIDSYIKQVNQNGENDEMIKKNAGLGEGGVSKESLDISPDPNVLKNKKPYKAKIFGWITLLIAITYFTFPYGLYEKYMEPYKGFPNYTATIQSTTIYKDALVALTPWLTFSPWWVFDQGINYCDDFGCLGLVIEVPAVLLIWYVVLFFLLVNIFKPKQSRNRKKIYLSILGTLWLLSLVFGINLIYKNFILVSQKYNSALEKLSTISGQAPFPDGTEILTSKGFNRNKWDSYFLLERNFPPYLNFVKHKSKDENDLFIADVYFGSISKEELLKKCSISGNIQQVKLEKDHLPIPPQKYLFIAENTMLQAKDPDSFGQNDIWPFTDYISEEAPGIFACKDDGRFVGYLGSNQDIYFIGRGPEQLRQNDGLFFNLHRTIPGFIKYYLE